MREREHSRGAWGPRLRWEEVHKGWCSPKGSTETGQMDPPTKRLPGSGPAAARERHPGRSGRGGFHPEHEPSHQEWPGKRPS